jgi:hypothetical protein
LAYTLLVDKSLFTFVNEMSVGQMIFDQKALSQPEAYAIKLFTVATETTVLKV